ncbi:MAG: glyoxalase [Gammaproteobacteria bacterium]|nr:glyoxalase [Gammaproteobacteria bacterium]
MSGENSPDLSLNVEEADTSSIGRIEWVDLSVGDAARSKDFYCKVIGWKPTDVEMGTYSDFNLKLPDSGQTMAGICHARGMNANLPAQWLMYVRVVDVTASAAEAERQKGKVLDGPRRMGGSNFCVIQDPDGAVMALISD